MTESGYTPRKRALLPFYPALDGLRGLFVVAVVMYHAHFSFSGALILMAGFFVLSGFLIGSLLIAEFERDGRVDIPQFLLRRARRLLPASMITIVACAALWNVFDLRDPGGVDPAVVARETNVDLLTATFYVYNWKLIDGPIWAGFGAMMLPRAPESSPINHLWSLAVEEQFYLLFPLFAVAALFWARGRRGLGAVSILGIVLAIALQPTLDGQLGVEKALVMNRIYVGTDVRVAEFLTGVVMAVAFARPAMREWITTSRWVAAAGITVFAIVTWGVFAFHITSYWLYGRGGFAATGLVFAVLIFALTQKSGPLVWLHDFAALRWLGERSYGLYVYHFPIMRILDDLVDWSRWPLLIAQVGLTLLAGAVSYSYFELPIRQGRWRRRRT